MIKKIFKINTLLLCSVIICVANAQDSSVNQTASTIQKIDAQHLTFACISCHSSPNMPKLSGMPFEKLNKKMQEYAKDLTKDTVMHQLLKGYSDQEIKAMATYFSEEK